MTNAICGGRGSYEVAYGVQMTRKVSDCQYDLAVKVQGQNYLILQNAYLWPPITVNSNITNSFRLFFTSFIFCNLSKSAYL